MKKQLHYPPFYLRAIISIVAAGFIVLYGTNHSLWEALHIPSFYFAMSCSFIIAMILVNYIHLVTVRLDINYSWKERLAHRSILQLFFGLVIPAVMDFFLAWVYFYFYGHDMYKTGYMLNAFPQIVLMLAILNLVYIILFLLQSAVTVHLPSSSQLMPQTFTSSYIQTPLIEKETVIEPVNLSSNEVNEIVPSISNSTGETLFNLHSGLALPYSEIACLFRIGDSNYLYTFSGKKHLLIRPLKKVEAQLTGNVFFRINRQMIINRDFIQRLDEGTKKGTLQIVPKEMLLDKSLTPELFVVVAEKVGFFRLWISLSGGH